MEETKNNYMTIFSLKLAGYLMMNGFLLLDMSDHIDGSGKKVFYFKKSNYLLKKIDEYKSMIH